MKDKKDKNETGVKTSTVVALVVGAVAVTGIAAWGLSAKAATPKKPKPPKPSKPPKSRTSPRRTSPKLQPPEAENKLPRQPASGDGPENGADGGKVRRPVMPDPREASWSELEDTVALLSSDAQWKFAVPEERAGIFPEGETVTLRMDTADGMVASQATATSVGFNLISRLGPSVSYNRESGVLQIYAGGYAGRIEIEAVGVSLSAWVLSEHARMTLGDDRRSRHLIDERVDGVWQAHAFVVGEDGSSLAHEFGEFLSREEAVDWADAWLDEQQEAAA